MSIDSGQAAASRQGTRAAEQLLYSNVDRVVDGRSTSGWQTMEVSSGLDEAASKLLLNLVEPILNPPRALPGFPTPEEVATAERRMAQTPLGIGTALVHTAPAGVDTTGRPNTISHVLLLPEQPAPTVPTAALWRSAGWVVPFGPEQVREASLPDPAAIVPGMAVTEDTVAAFIAAAPRGPVLAALADALEERLIQRLAGADCSVQPTSVVAVACDSTDEAALWVACLQLTCAPATTGRLGFSTLERIAGSRDLERVAGKGLDLVFMPRSDLEAAGRAKALVIDPAAPPTELPRTGWGRLVYAVAQNLGSWMAGTQAQRDILSLLSDHRTLSPGWPLAVAECCDPGLLGDIAGTGLDESIEHELVVCWPAELSNQPYLAQVISARVLGSSTQDPARWWKRLEAIPDNQRLNTVVAGLVSKYLETAALSREWLLDPQRQPDPGTHRFLRTWSAAPENASALSGLLRTMLRTVESQGPDLLLRLVLADRLIRDGIQLPGDYVDELLQGVCALLIQPRGRDLERLLATPISQSTRALLAQRVDVMLQAEAVAAAPWTLPAHLPGPLVWAAQDLDHLGPWLGGELAAAVVCGNLGARALPEGTDAVAALIDGAARSGLQLRCTPELVEQLAYQLTPEQARRLPDGMLDRDELLTAVALAHPDNDASQELATWFLQRRRHPVQQLVSVRMQGFSVHTARCVVTMFSRFHLLGLPPASAQVLCQNVLEALSQLVMEANGPRRSSLGRARDKALAGLLLSVWQQHPVSQVPAWVTPELLAGLPSRLQEDPTLVSPVNAAEVEAWLQMPTALLFWCSNKDRTPDEWAAHVDHHLQTFDAAERASVPALVGRDDAALAVCRACLATQNQDDQGALAERLVQLVGNPPGFSKWFNKSVLAPANGPVSGLRRLFGSRGSSTGKESHA
ncbi:Uncharacterised protein [Actinomyces bovis]|uniref:GTPase-associated protein 1 N-terminal domain-containing protein n=1 Tax=Actinomyces bovis TaxID=1658 RepID=A0ABY1VLG2_9ACTO|nr:hypothetical protein [Actinomyces bovis]SPT52938.1 Uncharacterised protein [Actinomyces bovis]VEG55115.1 Uncharacterised protein [Actinomyces israelii]